MYIEREMNSGVLNLNLFQIYGILSKLSKMYMERSQHDIRLKILEAC